MEKRERLPLRRVEIRAEAEYFSPTSKRFEIKMADVHFSECIAVRNSLTKDCTLTSVEGKAREIIFFMLLIFHVSSN